MKKLLISSLGVVVLLASFAVPVMAAGDNGQFDSDVNDPAIAIDAGWSATTSVPPAFFWAAGTPQVPSYSDTFTFTNTGQVRVDVTDDFMKGDQFRVYDNGAVIGDTSSVAVVAGAEVGPEAAFNDATYSSGSFNLGAGSHSIEIEAITDPWSGGRGYIRVVQLHAIGDIKEPTPFTPDPTGNGRAVAFDGKDLYYTLYPNTNIYKVSTSNVPIATIVTKIDDDADGVADEDPIDGVDNDLDGLVDEDPPEGGVQLGALSWDSGLLWGGSYNGTTDVYTINPTTGVATWQFNEAAFSGIAADSAYGAGNENFIDGLAYDATDNTLWLSGDACATIYHLNTDGSLIASFSVPNHPATGTQGYNTGITVAPGGFLEIAMQAGADTGPHVIAKVTKEDPSTIVYSFVALGTNNPGVEGIAYDANTYAPRAVVWTNQFGATNALTAFDVQVTRTIGYWKNHPPADFDGTTFLPINLGISDADGLPCTTVTTAAEVKDVLQAAKAKDAADMLMAQLLAAKFNLAMGDIPLADVVAIAPVIAAADALLGRNSCDPDTGKKGADRAEATDLISQLDSFNNKYSP